MQAFFESWQESLIRGLYLVIALWVPWGRVQVFDLQLATKIPVYPAIELWPIVGYNQLRYSKSAHNVFPYELNNDFIFDGCEGFSFYPFAEIVGGNQ